MKQKKTMKLETEKQYRKSMKIKAVFFNMLLKFINLYPD